MIQNFRPALVALVMLSVAGCQTASLEDAAPRSAPVTVSDASVAAPGSAQTPVSASDETSADPTIIRRNPGFTSLVPIEKTVPVKNKEFVATGARRTGQYPIIGLQPRAANLQLTDADKLAAEAEMTELLRSRALTPDARAQYEARLKQLRALAANHGSDTQQEIEK